MRDKRRHPRIDLELKITFTPSGVKRKIIEKRGYVADLSKKGVSVCTDIGDDLSEDFRGKIFVPGEAEPIRFTAKACWTKKKDKLTKESGFEFTRLTPIDKKRIDALVKRVWIQMLTVY
ncbi:MAG: c-di-GMP-binding flagellar brake protein YcgR [Candidatus Omnitrophota bacterium]|jgi:c-di-GMP-binding flagellar brake protein YcgR